jgi:glycosyltransferase involved in cell wall biosynthesis
MRFTIITPCRNAVAHIDACVDSIMAQLGDGVELEYIVLDACSTDGTVERLRARGGAVTRLISEADRGPADAINRGLSLATGDVVGWLNADDEYLPGTLSRVGAFFNTHPEAVFCFGHCPIIDADGKEIRKPITRFKELFFPLHSRFTFQCINYISQPAFFFRREAALAAGPLRIDLTAAWDYEFFLRLFRQGHGGILPRPPLANFRWQATSISGQHFRRQFDEEFRAARADAGTWSLQTLIHWFVKTGIVAIYSLMARRRSPS